MSEHVHICEQLAGRDTPALSNALRRTEAGADGQAYTDGSLRRIAGGRFLGTAVTATMRASEPGDDAVPVAELHRAVLAAEGPVVVVVQDLDEVPGAGASLGEVNGTLLAAPAISGFVTNGRVRDEPDLRAMGFAVHAAGLCVARAHMRLTAIGVPVRVGGLDVEPGDLLHGDQHGVLRVPRAVAGRLPAPAEEVRAEERSIVTWARSPEFTPEGLLALKRVRHQAARCASSSPGPRPGTCSHRSPGSAR
ncbi:RraA family protein [Actinomadura madurae]|uniref:RraA family protein n=1 Tax=Actinomadura madurae TaxID=1993 RepID=UPI000D813218|nr:RraA family protein [Actinomadura madurae]SPT52166.1 4-carboxy-4-hydroxy-2-oxoadipate aldolase/oxaloacetate decarboxylase [Actinomadura madurae]